MYCKKCGMQLSEDDKKCKSCGYEVEDADINLISLKCKSCGAQLKMSENQELLYCEFCGSKVLIDDEATEESRLHRVKLKSKKELDEHNLEYKKKVDSYIEDKKYNNTKTDGAIKIFSIVFAVMALVFMFVSIDEHAWISAVMAFLQIVAFGYTFLLCLNILKEVSKNTYKVAFTIGCCLIFPLLMFNDVTYEFHGQIDWPNSNIANAIPKYGDNIKGEISFNYDDSLSIYIDNVSKNDYLDYLQKCKDAGYTIDAKESFEYEAYNDDGYKLELYYYSSAKELSIDIEAPMKFVKISWPINELSQDLPNIPSDMGNIDINYEKHIVVYLDNINEDDFNDYIEECQSMGYREKFEKKNNYFSAYKGNKRLTLNFIRNRIMSISLEDY